MSTIVVVEDEAIVAHDIQDALVQLGYEAPRPCATGLEALRSVELTHPDLVLMDIRLKGELDGIATAKQLRARWSIPIVYLTAHSDEATLDRAKDTCPHGYLLKPFYKQDLRATIEMALCRASAEQAVEERERWFATTLESIGDAVIATDRDAVITFMNSLAESLTGWPRQEALGKPLGDVLQLVGGDGASQESPVARAIRDRIRVEPTSHSRLRSRSGRELPVNDAATAIVDNEGRVLGGVVVFRDVSQQLRLEQRLTLTERLASIGTLTAGIAHEINNPLAAVVGNVSYAFRRLDDWARAPAHEPFAAEIRQCIGALDDAAQAADRVRRIVADLKAFSRSDSSRPGPIALVDAIEAAIKLTTNQVRHCAQLERVYEARPTVIADEGRLVQVFTNLLVNAADAVSEGPASRQRIRVVTREQSGQRAIVEIQDTGPGIAADVARRIFDPFFSTKGIGVGMGLGLSICHGIISDAGGEISVESTPGVGTTFRISLPLAPAQQSVPAVPMPRQAHPRSSRILVIDDEEAVCRTLKRLLEGRHDVTTNTDPAAALGRIAAGETFDVIFCDVMMPTMSGVDFYEAIQRVRPHLASRIVFLTGGAFSERTTRFLQGAAIRVLLKPFSMQALNAIIEAHEPM